MKLSTRARYGARALVELAARRAEPSLSVKNLAASQSISHKYLEQIMSKLRVAGLVRADRGMNGGYRLARPAARITLGHVFEAIEGSTAPADSSMIPMPTPWPTSVRRATHGSRSRNRSTISCTEQRSSTWLTGLSERRSSGVATVSHAVAVAFEGNETLEDR